MGLNSGEYLGQVQRLSTFASDPKIAQLYRERNI